MKTYLVTFAVVSLCFELFGTPFEDLNFESANTNNISDTRSPGFYFGPISDLLPGWQLSLGTGGESTLGYNVFPPGRGALTIVDANNAVGYPIVGFYTLCLSGTVFPSVGYTAFSLTQTGDIPSGAMSIRFITFGAPYDLAVNGTPIGLTYDYQPGNFFANFRPANVKGDISAFAGQTVQLTFTTRYDPLIVLNGLDEISFSTIAVPEPGTWLLLSLGSVAIVFQRRRQ